MNLLCGNESRLDAYLNEQDKLSDATEALRAEAEREWNAIAPTVWISDFMAYHADPDIDAAIEDFRRNWVEEWMRNR